MRGAGARARPRFGGSDAAASGAGVESRWPRYPHLRLVRDRDPSAEERARRRPLPTPDELETSLPKRLLDVVFSVTGLLLTSPAWIVLPIAIKLEDGGPVFFRHERLGLGGEPFSPLKFRSMCPCGRGERKPQQAQPDGELITTVGGLMRATALDELPQLWNILRGDMSLVGPRAVPPEEKAGGAEAETVDVAEIPRFGTRHRVRPGLTGLAQVYLPRDATHRRKFRYDAFYVRRRSLRLDLWLIVVSVWISLRGAWPDVGSDV